MTENTNRRSFLKLGASSIAAVFLPENMMAQTNDTGEVRIDDAFLYLSQSGRLGIFIDKAEMGQGVTSLYPALAAEQLNSRPEWLEYSFSSVGRKEYLNKKMIVPLPIELLEKVGLGSLTVPIQLTGLSTSAADAWEKVPKHVAGAKSLLAQVAAQKLGTSENNLEFREFGVHAEGASVSYVDLVGGLGGKKAGEVSPQLDSFAILGKERSALGASGIRHDILEKVLGTAKFGIDVNAQDFSQESVLVAVLVRSPERGAPLTPKNASQVKQEKGVVDVFSIEDNKAVAVVGNSYWECRQAASKLKYEQSRAVNSNLSDAGVRALYSELIEKNRGTVNNIGSRAGVKSGLSSSANTVVARYSAPYVPHVTMEPMTASALHTGRKLVLWAPTQFQGAAKVAAAKKANLRTDDVDFKTCYLGGGFGRRINLDFVEAVAEIANKMRGKAVKLIYSREDDIKHDFYRPMALHKLEAGFTGNKVNAWCHNLASQPINAFMVDDYLAGLNIDLPFVGGIGTGLLNKKQLDPFSHEGAEKVPYKVGAHLLQSRQPRQHDMPGMPIGFWRSVGHSHSAFAKESFVDELAHRMGEDPLAWRLARSTEPKEKNILTLLQKRLSAEETADWGVAVHSGWGSHCAMAAQVELTDDNQLNVKKIVAVVDCGFAVQPDIVRSQVEGGIIFALSAALKQEINFENGVVKQSNFYDSDVIRMNESPEMDIEIVKHPASVKPTGIGELPVPPVAPAVANALYHVAGVRVRDMPFNANNIEKARKEQP